MDDKIDLKEHFINNDDIITIELKVIGDRDKVIRDIMMSISKEQEIFDGVKVNKIFFKNKGVNDIINDAVSTVLTTLNTEIDKIKKSY